MSEIAKCPICGDGPDILVDLFDKHGKYPKGYSCCGAEFAELDQWNQYAAAMELAKRHKELDNYKGVNPNIVMDLVHDITVAEHYVLEVFK